MNTADDVVEIMQLVLRERQGRDRGWWQQMREAFAIDSVVHLSWYSGDGARFVSESERMSGNGDVAVHRISPPVVHVEGDRAIAEMSCGIEFQVTIDAIPAHLISYTRVNYRLIRAVGQWKVAQMDAIYERDTLTPAFPGDRIDIGETAVTDYRRSYALLAHYLRGRGYDIRDDLLGDDRPAEVSQFYSELLQWLHGDGQASAESA